jgi:hypothetical protein
MHLSPRMIHVITLRRGILLLLSWSRLHVHLWPLRRRSPEVGVRQRRRETSPWMNHEGRMRTVSAGGERQRSVDVSADMKVFGRVVMLGITLWSLSFGVEFKGAGADCDSRARESYSKYAPNLRLLHTLTNDTQYPRNASTIYQQQRFLDNESICARRRV